jgi:glycosyltransferase involved in cell wall biosynthesis
MEIIIIDNASTDNTKEVATQYWEKNKKDRNIKFKIVKEEKQGLVHARIRGVLEASAPIVCFIDDDNAPERKDYITVGISEFSDRSVGLAVSRIFPNYQSRITPSMQKREHLLAINNKLGDRRIEWESTPSLCPSIGAGMWLRREIFLSSVPWKTPEALLSDRRGNNLVSGGDIEIGYFIGSAGFKRIYSPNLRLEHVIPDRRLITRYFCKLINGVVRSTLTLELKYDRKKFGLASKLITVVELLGIFLIAPLFVFRLDGMRELIFVIAARWAKLQGPYPVTSQS